MRLLTCEEVAPMLGVQPATVREWVRAGTIPHVRIGRSIRFSEPALEAWVERQIEARWPECAVSSD